MVLACDLPQPSLGGWLGAERLVRGFRLAVLCSIELGGWLKL